MTRTADMGHWSVLAGPQNIILISDVHSGSLGMLESCAFAIAQGGGDLTNARGDSLGKEDNWKLVPRS